MEESLAWLVFLVLIAMEALCAKRQWRHYVPSVQTEGAYGSLEGV